MTCQCCGQSLAFQWSDTHGIGVCITCGLPYTILHYDNDGRRIEKPPEPAITAEGVEIAKRYWAEQKRRVFPAYFDIGMSGDRSYSGATREDCEAFSEWGRATYPKEEAGV